MAMNTNTTLTTISATTIAITEANKGFSSKPTISTTPISCRGKTK